MLARPSLADLDPARDVVLMMEGWEECTTVLHHPQKIVLILGHAVFACALEARGVRVDYVRLDDREHAQLHRRGGAVARHGAASASSRPSLANGACAR